jgi:hypothetical protein
MTAFNDNKITSRMVEEEAILRETLEEIKAEQAAYGIYDKEREESHDEAYYRVDDSFSRGVEFRFISLRSNPFDSTEEEEKEGGYGDEYEEYRDTVSDCTDPISVFSESA